MESKDKDSHNLYKDFGKLSNEELFKELESNSVVHRVNAIDVLSTRINDKGVLNRLLHVINDKKSKHMKAVGFLSVSHIAIVYLLRTKSSKIKSMVDSILQNWSEAEKRDLLIYLRSQNLYD